MKKIEGEVERINNYKINNFSFLHWLGIIFVTLGHQYILMGYGAPRILGVECSYLGVIILFAVSGYLVMESYKRTGNAKKWLIKRVVRIWSGLIVCIFSTVFMLGPFLTTLPIADYFAYCKRYIISNLIMSPVFDLPGVFSDNIYPVTVNGSLWTLPVEVMCYFSLPLMLFIAIILKKINKKIHMIFVIVLFGLLCVMYVLHDGGIFVSNYVVWGTDWLKSFRLIFYFALGVGFSCYGKKEKLKLQWAILLITIYMFVPGIFNVIIRPFVIVYFVFALAFDYPPLLDKIAGRFECYYSFYLWSFPIQQTLIYICIIKVSMELSPILLFIVSSLLIFLISYFITKYIEEPINRKIMCRIK